MGLDNKTLISFKERANTYGKKMNWVKDKKFILPLITEPFGTKQALEICAGTGKVSALFKDFGWEVTLLDLSYDMLQNSNQVNFVVGDMHDIPFEKDSFDLVICRQGLQYSNLEKVFQEVYRVSKKEFRIAHITKEKGDETLFWEKYFEIASPGRKHIFSPGQLEKVALENNYKIVNKEVIAQQDYFLGPLLHFPEAKQKKLVNMLLDMDDKFKKIYNVRIVNGEITYSNRWEFIILEK